jgi:hypothetical protein
MKYKYAIGMDLDGVIHIPSLVTIDSGIQMIACAYTQCTSDEPIFIFQHKADELKLELATHLHKRMSF